MRMFDDVWVLEASWSSRTIQQLTPLHILSLSIMTTWWHSSRPKEWCRPLRLSWTSPRVPSPATKVEWIRESHRFDSFKRKEQHNCCLQLHTTWPSFRIHIPGPMAWKLSGKSRSGWGDDLTPKLPVSSCFYTWEQCGKSWTTGFGYYFQATKNCCQKKPRDTVFFYR